MNHQTELRVAVVIPCFRAADTVLDVIASIGSEVQRIYVVDDACPDRTAERVRSDCTDPRVEVLEHEENQGVGGAVASGYRAALDEGMDIVVKLDADGQMDPALISSLIRPLVLGRADYVKGNRFHRISDVRTMPTVRLFGNAVLSFMTKLSSGYWQLFDPTNGFTAIHRAALASLDLDRVAKRYFFESDLLYHLNQVGAVIVQMPMRAVYADEVSSLRPGRTILPFLAGHARNFARRVFYSYFPKFLCSIAGAVVWCAPAFVWRHFRGHALGALHRGGRAGDRRHGDAGCFADHRGQPIAAVLAELRHGFGARQTGADLCAGQGY